MTSPSQARAHLAKAKEFLEAARAMVELEMYNAAASSAVTAGINAKDAICLQLTGRTSKADSHEQAVVELRAAGGAGRDLAPTLGRLLRLKGKSQYQAVSVSQTDAARAVAWAERMVQAAAEVVVA